MPKIFTFEVGDKVIEVEAENVQDATEFANSYQPKELSNKYSDIPEKRVTYDKDIMNFLRTPQRAVEGLTKKISAAMPEPKPEQGMMENIVKGVPKIATEIAGETAAGMVSPEAAVFGVIGKGTGVLKKMAMAEGSPIAGLVKKVWDKVPEKVKKELIYRYGQPEKYVEAAEGLKTNIATAQEKMMAVAKPIIELGKKDQTMIGDYLRGTLKELPENLKGAADKVRSAFVELGGEAVNLGFLDKNTYIKNIMTYLPRFYREKELAKNFFRQGFKPTRAELDRFKHRADIPEDIRKGFGEIMEAGYPTVKGLTQLARAVERGNFFKLVSSNAEWVAKSAEEGLARGFQQLPKVKSLGSLAGKWVEKSIHEDLNQLVKVPSTAEKFIQSSLNAWKYGKVVLNPGTHFRNMFSNTIMLDLSGLPLVKQPIYLYRAAKEMAKQGKHFLEAKASGLIGSEFVGNEIKSLTSQLRPEYESNMLFKVADYAKKAAKAFGDKYQLEEQWFKMAKFIAEREKGVGVKEAADQAEKWMFNYAKVPKIIERVRRNPLGSPFITYTSKVIPRLAEVITNNPMKFYKYIALMDAVDEVSARKLGLSDEQVKTMKKAQPGHSVLLPFPKTKEGYQMFDTSYGLPWGSIFERGTIGALSPAFSPLGGPMGAVIDVLRNRSSYFNQPIVSELDPKWLKAAKISDYMGKAILPSWTPGVAGQESPFRGGYSFQRMSNAIVGKPRPPYKEVQSVPQAIADTIFGLRTRPVSPQKAERKLNIVMKKEIQELYEDTIKINRNPATTKEEKKRAIERFKKAYKKRIRDDRD